MSLQWALWRFFIGGMVMVGSKGFARWCFGDAWHCHEGIGVECNVGVAVVVPN